MLINLFSHTVVSIEYVLHFYREDTEQKYIADISLQSMCTFYWIPVVTLIQMSQGESPVNYNFKKYSSNDTTYDFQRRVYSAISFLSSLP